MAVSREYLDFVLDQFSGVGVVTWRRMFGGVGISVGGLFCAIIAGDTLYLKVDEANRPDYEAAGMGPFRPYLESTTVMSYYEVPLDVLEDRDELHGWVRKAMAAAGRQPAKQSRKK